MKDKRDIPAKNVAASRSCDKNGARDGGKDSDNPPGEYAVSPHMGNERVVALWLYFCAAFIFLILVIGGVTRLTESGLSITEWQLFTGILPPLNEAQWVAAFEKYKKIPEYIEINGPAGMMLDDFKRIYFWEWVHRFLARTVGLVYALPLFWFWVRGRISPGYKPALLFLLFLGGLQGAVGWWMVSSGLVYRTDVSHFRLAIHLINALFLYIGVLWVAMDMQEKYDRRRRDTTGWPDRISLGLLILFMIQLIFGAFTAGLNAGYVSNSWPLMNGSIFPANIDWEDGVLYALFNDPLLIHFIHRWLAVILLIWLFFFAWRLRMLAGRWSFTLIAMGLAQLLLGIITVISGVSFTAALLHQAGAAILLALLLKLMHVRRAGCLSPKG